MKRIDPLRLDSQPQRKVEWPSTFWINVSIQATAHLPSPKPKFILTCYQLNVGLGGVGVDAQILTYDRLADSWSEFFQMPITELIIYRFSQA